jgi:hypothetical protein
MFGNATYQVLGLFALEEISKDGVGPSFRWVKTEYLYYVSPRKLRLLPDAASKF